jgi:hypothetical protein
LLQAAGCQEVGLFKAVKTPVGHVLGRNALKGYVRSVVLRNNTITGVTYRDDPTIMAWDLVNEPFNPGDDTGKVLTVSVATIPL